MSEAQCWALTTPVATPEGEPAAGLPVPYWVDAPVGSPDAGPAGSPPVDAPAAAWLLPVLQQMLTEVMASEAPPLKKAGIVARLGALYLKALRSSEQVKAQEQLVRRVAELERLALPATSDASAASGEMAKGDAVPVRAARADREEEPKGRSSEQGSGAEDGGQVRIAGGMQEDDHPEVCRAGIGANPD